MSGELTTVGLSGVEEHIDAMVDAQTPFEAALVLKSALDKHLGGQFVQCDEHGGDPMTFAQLLKHTGLMHHERGQIRPADPDPIEVRRFGGDV